MGGTYDLTVPIVWVEATKNFYEHYEANIFYEELPISHLIPVDLPTDKVPFVACEGQVFKNTERVTTPIVVLIHLVRY